MRHLHLLLFAALLPLLFSCVGTPIQRLPLTLPPNAVLLDVRTPSEYQSGHLAGARNIPYDQVVNMRAALPQDIQTPIAVYCRGGRRAAEAIVILKQIGYQNLYNLGGFPQARQALLLNVVTGNTP